MTVKVWCNQPTVTREGREDLAPTMGGYLFVQI